MNTSRSKASRAGFTLLEMLVTLALMAILMSITVPTYASFAARHRLAAASDTLALDMRQARLDAIQRNAMLHLVVHAGAQWCYALSTDPGCDCRSADAQCAIRRVDSSDFAGVVMSDARSASFDGRFGRSAPGPVARLSAGGDLATAVRVHESGRASVCAAGNAMPGYPGC
jgi:type IV fimbrial biogenesis protein FimT